MKKKEVTVKNGRRFLTRAAVAGASLLLASVLLQVPGIGSEGNTGFSLFQVAEADEVTLTQTSGKCGKNATWTFDPSTGTLTIKGSGPIHDYDYWDDFSPFNGKKNIKKVVIGSGITAIGRSTFTGCSNLTSVEFPSTLTHINVGAFEECGFEKITIPGTVKVLDCEVFDGCLDLEEIILEDGIEAIGVDCCVSTKVETLYIPKTVTNIYSNYGMHIDVVVDPENPVYKSIDGVLFDKNGKELIYFPSRRKGIYEVPNGVATLGHDSFLNSCLSKLYLPDSLLEIGDGSFSAMYELTDITIPKKAKFVSEYDNHFDSCDALERIDVAQGNPYYVSVDGVLYSKDKTCLYRYPSNKSSSSYTVLSSVSEIRGYAFYNASHLRSLSLPDNLELIGSGAFFKCSLLTDLVLPSKVDSFLGQSIDDCPNLKHLICLNRDDIDLELRMYSDCSEELILHTYPGATVNGIDPADYVASSRYFSGYTPIYDANATFVMMGKTAKLKVPSSISTSQSEDLEYVVRDDSVLEVSSAGVITPLCEGTTEVYACGSGAVVRYSVSVGFTDLKKSDYYYNAVYWAVDNGITGGVKDSDGFYSKFNPQGVCTRGQMISFLWRMAGCPKPKNTTTTFTDLDPNAYYYKAVLWGTEKKIVGGYADNTFRPQGICSRSQAVTFLWRYYGSPEPKATTSNFNDVTDKSAYYYKAVLWASENGITGGYSDGSFRLNGECSRAQMVTFLYRSRNIGK
ncbi:MAG: leucine-rich repeat protein [Lachnospiraceae bacterium]|nr:leucine-rich repeat protein [Lachnospiraceae bacterium]